MLVTHTEINGFKELLERKASELVHGKRDGIAIEKSPDQMDEIQYASERNLVIQNVDRETTVLREVRAALGRIHDGSFGTCIDCESPISPKRLVAVPWAPRCIHCQNVADQDEQDRTEDFSGTLVNAFCE